jgi:outer membrane protein assembly factor BamB
MEPGNSSTPTVADGRVFATGGLDGTGAEPHRLYAFDAMTGVPAWPNAWASSTGANLFIVAVADGLVVVGSSDGQLVALDAATGKVVWIRSDAGNFASPNGAVVGGTLFATVGGQRVMALDLATDTPIWTIQVKGDPSAPSIVDGRILLDTSLGKVIWISGGGPAPSLTAAPSGN